MRVPWKWLCLAVPAVLLVACEQERSPLATAPGTSPTMASDYTNNSDGGGPYIARYETNQYFGYFDSDDGLVRAFFTTFPLDSTLPWTWNSGVCGPPRISALHFQLISHWDTTFSDPSQLYFDKVHGEVWIALVSRAPGATGVCGGRPLIASGWGKMAYIDNNASFVPTIPGGRTHDAWSFQVLGTGTTPAGDPVKMHALLSCVANPGNGGVACRPHVTATPISQGAPKPAGALAVTDLGTLGGYTSYARAINSTGWVAGWSDVLEPGVTHAFLWRDGVMTDLGTLGGTSSRAYGINNAGEVVGTSQLAGDAIWHAFKWAHGTMTDIGGLGGAYAEGFDINNAGDVVGYADLPGQTEGHTFLWQRGSITDLGTLGGSFSYANGINSSGVVAGGSITPSYAWHAAIWKDGVVTDLGTLGGYSSGAAHINAAGLVVGGADGADGVGHGFIWDGTQMRDLGNLGGWYTYAQGINDVGEVVGGSCLPWWICDAFIWKNGTMTDLGTLPGGWTGSWAQAINSRGQVVGNSGTPTGQPHAALWVTR